MHSTSTLRVPPCFCACLSATAQKGDLVGGMLAQWEGRGGGREVPYQIADDHVTAINWALTDSIHPGNRL